MLLLKAKGNEQYPVEREKRRAAVLEHHRTWHNLIEHGTYGLVSASRSQHTTGQNRQKTQELYHHLVAGGHRPVPATGYYREEGQTHAKPEHSFLVPHSNARHLHEHMTQLAAHHNQESYLARHEGKHYLVYPKGTKEKPYPHYYEGSHIEHNVKSSEDRTVLHTGEHHNQSFRATDLFDREPHAGTMKSEGGPGRNRFYDNQMREVVIHTTWGSYRVRMHFDSGPKHLRELNPK